MKALADKYIPKWLKAFFEDHKELIFLIVMILAALLIAGAITYGVFRLLTRETPGEDAEDAEEEDEEEDCFMEEA